MRPCPHKKRVKIFAALAARRGKLAQPRMANKNICRRRGKTPGGSRGKLVKTPGSSRGKAGPNGRGSKNSPIQSVLEASPTPAATQARNPSRTSQPFPSPCLPHTSTVCGNLTFRYPPHIIEHTKLAATPRRARAPAAPKQRRSQLRNGLQAYADRIPAHSNSRTSSTAATLD